MLFTVVTLKGATGSRSNRFISNCNSKPLKLVKGILRLPLPVGKLEDSLYYSESEFAMSYLNSYIHSSVVELIETA